MMHVSTTSPRKRPRRSSRRLPRVKYAKLGRFQADGRYGHRVIEVDPRLKPRRTLDVLLHEMLHHLFPWMEENFVDKSAKQLMRLLWREKVRIIR